MNLEEALEAADSFAEYAEEGSPVFVARILAAKLKRYEEREPLVQELVRCAANRDYDYQAYDSVVLKNAMENVRDFEMT